MKMSPNLCTFMLAYAKVKLCQNDIIFYNNELLNRSKIINLSCVHLLNTLIVLSEIIRKNLNFNVTNTQTIPKWSFLILNPATIHKINIQQLNFTYLNLTAIPLPILKSLATQWPRENSSGAENTSPFNSDIIYCLWWGRRSLALEYPKNNHNTYCIESFPMSKK